MRLTKEEIERLDGDVDGYFAEIGTDTEGQFPFLVNTNSGDDVHLASLEGALLDGQALDGFGRKIRGM